MHYNYFLGPQSPARSTSQSPTGSQRSSRSSNSTPDGSMKRKSSLKKAPVAVKDEPFFIEIYEAQSNGVHTKNEIVHMPPKMSPSSSEAPNSRAINIPITSLNLSSHNPVAKKPPIPAPR